MRMPVKFRQSLRALPLICLFTSAAHAQLSGSAGILSNYMYRGISFSADKPAARLALNYDAPGGWYAGGQVVSGQLSTETHRYAQWLGYAGYAQRLSSGLSWEAGGTAYAYSGTPGWNFRELYVGIAAAKISARLHYAPDYLGFGERTLYAELNGGMPLTRRLNFFWHAGYLYSRDNTQTNHPEARLGLAASSNGWQAQLSLDMVRQRAVSTGGYYSEAGESKVRHEVVLALARSF